MSHDAIVIGTGIGGSVAAAVLATEGLNVVVLEKNPRTGGVCSFYEKHGFKVDIGTHLFSRGKRGPLGTLARRVGARPIPFLQTRDLSLIKGFGGEITVPRAAHRYPVFLMHAVRQLRLKPKEIYEATRFFSAIIRFDEAKLAELDRVTMWDFVTRYTKNPRLVGVFGLLLGLYFILPLREVSAGEGVWCFKRMVFDRGLSYPRGGAITVPETFLQVARDRGAVVHTRHRVSKICVDGGVVRGVECKGGASFEAPIVIGTTSLKDLVEDLVGPDHFPAEYVARVRSLRSSMVAVQVKLALRKPLIAAGSLVAIAGAGRSYIDDLGLDDLDKLYDDVTAGRLAAITPIYAPIPTNFDASLAPDGAQLITACAVAPTTDVTLIDGPQRWIDNMMASLHELIPGLDRELMWFDTFTTAAIGRWMGKRFAPAISTGQTPDQVGNRRPPVHTPIHGLYACGCGAGARGVGTELAATSGAEAADRVIQDLFNGIVTGRRRLFSVAPSPHATRASPAGRR